MRYIDADKLQEDFKELHGGKRSLLIDTAPTADVVEADKVQKEIDYWHDKAQSYEQTILKLTLNKADVVEVVRCKYCIYWCKLKEDNGVVVRIHHNELRSQCLNINGLNKTDCITEANDYCSYGERADE